MAHWFHRNSIKNTVPVRFDELKKCASGSESNKITTDLKLYRSRYVTNVSSHLSNPEEVRDSAITYTALLRGLITPPTDSASSSTQSKLRTLVPFKWTNSLGGKTPSIQSDALFEIISVLINLGIWYTKYAARLAADDGINMDIAKDIHSSLKQAGGIFTCVRDNLIPQLPAQLEKATDLDARILESYILQCQAEAQEITLARALELNHKPTIVLALAMDTSKMFSRAAHSLETLDKTVVGKWSAYLTLKAFFYDSYGYCFWGQHLLTEDKCGDSISALQHSKILYDKAEKLCKQYASAQGPGQPARPDRHPFFQRLGPMIIRFLEKSTHENGFIYHQKVPEFPQPPEYHETFGLAKLDEFTIPEMSELWTSNSYQSFRAPLVSDSGNTSTAGKSDAASKLGATPSQEEIAPIAEPDIAPQLPAVPKTQSGCVIS